MSKIVVISGASSGIGLATATYFTSHGYEVHGFSRNTPTNPVSFIHHQVDITDESAINSFIATLTKKQPIDVLINCAGNGVSGPIESATIADVASTLNVNFTGLFSLTKACLPSLRQSKGIIINIGSVAGVFPVPFQTLYSASKAAVHAFSEGLRNEVRPLGVRVTSVLPGDTKTGFTKARKHQNVVDAVYKSRSESSVIRMEKDEQNGRDPLTVSKVCLSLANKKNPPVMVTVGFDYKLLVFLNRILPKRLVSYLLYLLYGK